MTNNNTLINTHHTVPNSCSSSCPEGQCLDSIAELSPFSTNSTTFSTSSEEIGCRRVVAIYTHPGILGNSFGHVLTDNQVREMEDPCGQLFSCNVRSLGDYPTSLSIHVNESKIDNEFGDFFGIDVEGPDEDLLCVPIVSEEENGRILEKVVYSDGSCADFEDDNSCLRDGSFEKIGDVDITIESIIDNDITVENYVEQNCPEPVCGSEFCPTTEATEPNTISTTTVLVTEPTVTNIMTDDTTNTVPSITNDSGTATMDNSSSNNSINVGAIVGGVIASVFILASIATAIVATILLFKFNKIDKSILLKFKDKINKVLGRTSTVVSEHELESKAKDDNSAV